MITAGTHRRQQRAARIGIGAVALLGVAAVLMAHRRSLDIDPVQGLLQALPHDGRDIEPRLSGGFPWTPLRTRSTDDSGTLRIRAAAAAVLLQARNDAAPRRAAIAYVVIGNPRAALQALQSITLDVSDPKPWNDLAAAHYLLAIQEDQPEQFAHALVAADTALGVDSKYAQARFNRALILERLGLRDLALREWETYLQLDQETGWASEARAHARMLAPEEPFASAFAREVAHLASDARAAQAFARQYRQMARTFGETEVLGEWGRAFTNGHEIDAETHLRVAREFAAELARDRGNETFKALVAKIDNASPQERLLLAQGHVYLSDGRREFRARRFHVAQRLYATAAQKLGRGGSKVGELRARMYEANMDFEMGKPAEARREEARLLESIPSEFPAYRAETLWMLGAIAQTEGRFGVCFDSFRESLRLFERLGEDNYAAMVRGQMVFAYDRVGDPRAWTNRMIMLRELGRQISSTQTEALASVTHAALMEQNWAMALSFLKLEIDVARQVPGAPVLIQSLLFRAQTYGRMNRRRLALTDLSEARQRLASIEDSAVRASLEAIADAVEGAFVDNPAVAVRLFSHAIEFQSTKGRRAELPESLRKRAAAYRAAGDVNRAAEDLDSAVAELERHRGTLAGGEGRWGAFHAADELFRDAIDLALSRGDAQTAFDYAERARARALLETTSAQWEPLNVARIPRGTAIVEYAVFRDAVFIFVADERGVRGWRRPVSRATIVAAVAELRRAAMSDSRDLHKAGRELYRHLIEPVENELHGITSLVLVPDVTLGTTPFAVLVATDGKYLTQAYALSTAPSAAFFVHTEQPPALRREDNVLVVSGANAEDALAAANAEANSIVEAYRRATLLKGEAATPDAFLREVAGASIVHFTGHSIATDGAFLLLAGTSASERRLDQTRIAAMRFQRTSLVVLAACSTAEGDTRATEGTISVARAFLAAGVPTVVATSWAIDDGAAAKFFPMLHRHLADGLAPAEALRAVQLDWLRNDSKSPSMWAAVQVIGR